MDLKQFRDDNNKIFIKKKNMDIAILKGTEANNKNKQCNSTSQCQSQIALLT